MVFKMGADRDSGPARAGRSHHVVVELAGARAVSGTADRLCASTRFIVADQNSLWGMERSTMGQRRASIVEVSLLREIIGDEP